LRWKITRCFLESCVALENHALFLGTTRCAGKSRIVFWNHALRWKITHCFLEPRVALENHALFLGTTRCAGKSCVVFKNHALREKPCVIL